MCVCVSEVSIIDGYFSKFSVIYICMYIYIIYILYIYMTENVEKYPSIIFWCSPKLPDFI